MNERDNRLDKKEETKDNKDKSSRSFEVKASWSRAERQRRKRFESMVRRTMREYNKWKKNY